MILGSEAGSLPKGPANARMFSNEKTSLAFLTFNHASRSGNDRGLECSTTLIRSLASSKTLIYAFYDATGLKPCDLLRGDNERVIAEALAHPQRGARQELLPLRATRKQISSGYIYL